MSTKNTKILFFNIFNFIEAITVNKVITNFKTANITITIEIIKTSSVCGVFSSNYFHLLHEFSGFC